MQRDNKLSASAGATHRAWRFSQAVPRPASEGDDPRTQSSLGSDDNWQLTMGSDSDVSTPDPAPDASSNSKHHATLDSVPDAAPDAPPHSAPDAPPNSPPDAPPNSAPESVAADSAKPDQPDDDPLAVQWHDGDEESFVDDVKDVKLPHPSEPRHSQYPVKSPVFARAHDPADESLVTGFNADLRATASLSAVPHAVSETARLPTHRPPPRDEYDADDCDQPAIIPGYRGVNTRAAIAAEQSSPMPDSAARQTTWADRPRGNPVPMLSAPQQPDNSSRQSSPGVRGMNRVGSDSALSSQGGSIGSGSALRVSTGTSSDASDGSRKAAAKSVSFIAQGVEALKMSPKSRVREDIGPVPVTMLPTSASSSGRSSGSLKGPERKVSGLRMSIRDSKARLGAARLSASKRHQRRASAVEKTASHEMGSEVSATLSAADSDAPALPPLRSIPAHVLGEASAARMLSDQRLSTKSDGAYPRQSSELSQGSAREDRPLSMPQHTSSNFDSPLSSQATVTTGVFGSHGGASTLISAQRRRGYHLMNAAVKDLSFLECVVEILKGTTVLKRKNFMHAAEAQIWLTPDLQAVQYKVSKKGNAPITHMLTLARVRKLKGTERELSIEMIDEKKAIDFLFPSRDRADMWLSALCCLVPSHASVKSRNRRLELRDNYDPLLDTWNGKPLSSRKRLNEFILLGSIGRGSFGKVKLALSSEDRQFYAVKVLSKAMMRKRMRSAPLERNLRDAASPAQLTVSDVNEIVVMKALNHENVMKMKGVFDDVEEDRLYLVVEFLAKGPIMSSSKLTGAESISEDRARSAFVDVLCGLEYLHNNNIVHRDIKPDNLLQAGNGTVKISDFGAAVLYKGDERRDSEETQSHNTTVGTPAFSAPELCLSEKSPPCPARCYAADIWSLGATLFYMVYGRAPFIARSVFEMYDAICSQNLVFPDTPTVSKSLQTLIRQMLEKSPERRATFAIIIRSPWLTENVEVADKLAKLRSAILEHSESNGEDRRKTPTVNRAHGDVSGIRTRVGSKLSSS